MSTGNKSNHKVQAKSQDVAVSAEWNYPIPHPDILNKYSPELVQLFTDQFKSESEHRRAMERQALENDTKLAEAHANRVNTESSIKHRVYLTSSTVIIISLVATITFAWYGKSGEAFASFFIPLFYAYIGKNSKPKD